jgi:hypothetical protein
MARMRPELSEDQLRTVGSRAETRAYRALRDQLGAGILVIHSLAWLFRGRDGNLVEGEADFTVFFEHGGFLTIEVKGGGVGYDGAKGTWYSIDRNGDKHSIKDPFRQAQRERFAVLEQVKGHSDWRRWPGRRIEAGHAVLFPDLNDGKGLVGPDRPSAIIGVNRDLEDIVRWTEGAAAFFRDSKSDPLGSLGLSLVEGILCRSIEVRPFLAQSLHVEEIVRVRLTERQARVLRILGGRKRAVICGGAGTGKTLLAAEKARTLASIGSKVLFLCYNRPLADMLRRSMSDAPLVHVLSFHQLCDQRIAQVKSTVRRDLMKEAAAAYPGANEWEVHRPFALALSNEVLSQKFDAIVVDEAQDFSDEYWFAIEELLQDPKEGALYIFNDPNQALYRRHMNLPVKDESYYLTSNCRNTSHIHVAAYRYYKGEPTDPPEIEGTHIVRVEARSIQEQAAQIAREVSRLLTRENLKPAQIVILVLGRPKRLYYDALAGHSIGKFFWAVEVHDPEKVLVDTVSRFKGLEAAVVFLWLPPVLSEVDDREALYVGLSRAKSIVYTVGTNSACVAALERNGASDPGGR